MKTFTLLGLVAISALLILPTLAVRDLNCKTANDCERYEICVQPNPNSTRPTECQDFGVYGDGCTDKNWPDQDKNDPIYQGYGPCKADYWCRRESGPEVIYGICQPNKK